MQILLSTEVIKALTVCMLHVDFISVSLSFGEIKQLEHGPFDTKKWKLMLCYIYSFIL